MDAAPPSRTARTLTAIGFDDPHLRGLLLLLRLTTAALVLLHVTHSFLGVPWSPYFDLATERGYGEVFFQTLTAWSIVLLGITAVRRRAGTLLIWAAGSVYLLADDYFAIHERIGTWFAAGVIYVGPLSTHIGEGLWLLSVGLVLSVALAVGYLTGA